MLQLRGGWRLCCAGDLRAAGVVIEHGPVHRHMVVALGNSGEMPGAGGVVAESGVAHRAPNVGGGPKRMLVGASAEVVVCVYLGQKAQVWNVWLRPGYRGLRPG